MILTGRGTLDVHAARLLSDYANLDDAGVSRALEQTLVQRWGRPDLPAHLYRITALAAVIVAQGQLILLEPEVSDEAGLLDALFAACPSAALDVVDWDGTTRDWLLARAVAHERVMPRALVDARSYALVDALAAPRADHPAPVAGYEAECRRLYDPQARTMTDAEDIAAHTRSRARLWWRVCHARGALPAATRTLWQQRLGRDARA